MKIAIILLALSIILCGISGLRLSDKISKVNESVKHQQELINQLTGNNINNSDEIRNLKKEIYVHEIDSAYGIIDKADFDMRQWEFETKYLNDIVFVNRYSDGRPMYVCVDTTNKIIVSNCTYFQYPEYK